MSKAGKEQTSVGSLEKPKLVQMPFRCTEEFRSRVNRALGRKMTSTGQKITVNEFIRKLLEEGLKNLDG